ncbi:MAG: dephospho-CoA kinase [Candidatus Omnitrophota bacterium]
MTVIGLTGSLGTGKTTVACMFRELGAGVIDADQIAHHLIEEDHDCREEIKRKFPLAVGNGEINREKLAKEVFTDEMKLKALEEILHPAVYRYIKKGIRGFSRDKKVKVVVLDVPLLFEAGFEDLVDAVVVVRANQRQSIERVSHARHFKRQDILKRQRRQMPQREKLKLADFIIDNRKSIAETRAQVKTIWDGLASV